MTTFAPSFQMLPLRAIVPSPTNPRKHFDQAALDELADSIKATGVHTPVLVRPLPAHLNAQEAMQGIAAALQGEEAPDAARRSEAIPGADALGEGVGPASRPDAAATTDTGVQAGADDAAAALASQAAVVGEGSGPQGEWVYPKHEFTSDEALLAEAVKVVQDSGKASISLVQRTLKIGYNRAARLLEAMEKKGIVSPMTGMGDRTVLEGGAA